MAKKPAKERMKHRRSRFVVGYIGSGNVLFSNVSGTGKHQYGNGTPYAHSCIDPMSLAQARKYLKTMPCADCAIFELVPIEINR